MSAGSPRPGRIKVSSESAEGECVGNRSCIFSISSRRFCLALALAAVGQSLFSNESLALRLSFAGGDPSVLIRGHSQLAGKKRLLRAQTFKILRNIFGLKILSAGGSTGGAICVEGVHVQFKTGTADGVIAWNPSSLGGAETANETASCESSTQTMSMAPRPSL